MAEAFLIIGGIYHLAFAVFHLFFGRIFKWRISLLLTPSFNRSIMRVMNLSLIFLFVSVSSISFFGRELLLTKPSGKAIMVFIAGFWFWRAVLQAAFFGVRKPISILLVFVCLAGSALYGLLAAGSLGS
jgi:hypothetical protein